VPAPRKHVLIVEDDPAIRTLLEDVLRDSGYTVASAESGDEALDQMRARHPDLVLLDLMLPGMNGWTFLRTREKDRHLANVPVLVISAAGPSGTGHAQDLGAPVFLHKPFDIVQLLQEVKRLCSEPVRQCAWCGQVMDDAGEFRLRSGRKLRWATHGICPSCKEHERQELLR
jgi:DNA-binding response OmpR family regulator